MSSNLATPSAIIQFMVNKDRAQTAPNKTMLFEKDGRDVEVQCRVVDLSSSEFNEQFEDAPLYRKNAEVKARQATQVETIETPLDATNSVVEPGDWVVTNPQGETYRVKDEVFQRAYEAKEGEAGVFLSLGIPVKVVQVNENIVFPASWGSDQAVQAGGYVVERTDNQERYGIEEEAFKTTYEPVT